MECRSENELDELINLKMCQFDDLKISSFCTANSEQQETNN